MEKSVNKYLFIFNPKAGAGNDIVFKEELLRVLDNYLINYKLVETSAPKHAYRYTQEYISFGYKHFVIVGGDGTLNEVVNGMFTQKIVPTTDFFLGMIPMGTGNDWARYFQLSSNLDEAVKRIVDGDSILQDIGVITYYKDEVETQSYFVNIAGFGFDAAIVLATNKMHERGKRKKSAYLFNLLKCMIRYKNIFMQIDINGELVSGPVYSISVGNGKYSGGGMSQTPNACINDGLLDVTIYMRLTKLRIIRNVAKLYNGKILSIKGVSAYKTTKFTISSADSLFAEIDGEVIGGGPFTVSIIPNAIHVMGAN
jgi:YegS/Rv2252/BmrU family lipid kinase